MHDALEKAFLKHLPKGRMPGPDGVPDIVDAMLEGARHANASDIHLRPTSEAFEMCWRIDGVLRHVTYFTPELAPRIIARLKVLADLLTYRTDLPQEGRLQGGSEEVEMRVSTFPTLYGEKGVVRLFVGSGQYKRLNDLGLPQELLATLRGLLDKTSGVILATGPAGSGKTTTIYACLRELLDKSAGGRSLVTLEDPIEVAVDGVDQSQVSTAAGFTMDVGLRSLLRQDPEVMMVGEIRDRQTAETVFQASLTGHLVLTTFHAGSTAQAISRLIDMGIEPYLLRSGILAIVCQRLLRKLCACARPASGEGELLGLAVVQARVPAGCPACAGTGYRGRTIITEMFQPAESRLGKAILSRSDADHLEQLAIAAGMIDQRKGALAAVDAGLTSPAEYIRVFGLPRTA